MINLRRHKCVCLFVCDYESLLTWMLSAYSIDRLSLFVADFLIKALSSSNKSAQKLKHVGYRLASYNYAALIRGIKTILLTLYVGAHPRALLVFM